MVVAIEIMLATLFLMEFVIGNFGNGFIAFVNCMDWVKRRKISIVDRILIALAISRMEFLWSVFTIVLISSVKPDLAISTKMLKMANLAWILSSHFSIWLATCLSIFYFLKIANFYNFMFLYLKWRVEKVVSLAFLVSLVLLFSNIFVTNIHIDTWNDELKTNMSYNSTRNITWISRIVLRTNTMFTLIPFIVSLSTFFLLIFSLWSHLKKMHGNAQSPADASTAAHITALYTVVAFLLLYTIFFLSLVIQFWSLGFQRRETFNMFCSFFVIAFPSIHSYVLIWGHSKLKWASLLLIWWLSCRSKDMEPLSP